MTAARRVFEVLERLWLWPPYRWVVLSSQLFAKCRSARADCSPGDAMGQHRRSRVRERPRMRSCGTAGPGWRTFRGRMLHRLAELLEPRTSTPSRVWCAVWDGWGGLTWDLGGTARGCDERRPFAICPEKPKPQLMVGGLEVELRGFEPLTSCMPYGSAVVTRYPPTTTDVHEKADGCSLNEHRRG